MQKFETDEDKILIAKILDKQKFCESKNRITYSDFLNEKEKTFIKKNLRLENYFFYGVSDNADREILVFYPDKLNEELARNALENIISVIRITLPNELENEYEHRNYLSALIKIGVAREKIGDILVYSNGADIVVFNINKEYIIQSLKQLTRFRKSKIETICLENIRKKQDNFEESTIIVSSMRIDNIVSELFNCSRSKAEELIKNERVYINYEVILKSSKMVNIRDIVTIRGKGKFIVDGLVRNTRNERLVIKIKKYA
ncbi:MAG: hypothetical protein HFJ25_03240 [Clostridia bacterium]|jgi:RNA-binding protein YlmH|nr:hypothetical protein [Clostridia bacterium]